MNIAARLAAIVDPLPDGAAVSLPVEVIRGWLDEDAGEGMDLTIEEVGRLAGRAPSTVRTWCGQGRLPGAYRLQGREWRIPRTAIAALRGIAHAPSHGADNGDLGAWRRVQGGGRK